MMWALIPLKDFVEAKQRLSQWLDAAERRCLFHAMVEDTLAAVSASRCFDKVVLLSDDPSAPLLAEHFGFVCESERAVLGEDERPGLNQSVNAFVREVEDSCKALAVIHGDLPLLQVAELEQASAEHRAAGEAMTVVTDGRGDGSNIVLLSPPQALFSYGVGSCARHLSAATEAGLSAQSLNFTGASADIDTIEDLAVVLRNKPELLGKHTAAYLIESGIWQRVEHGIEASDNLHRLGTAKR